MADRLVDHISIFNRTLADLSEPDRLNYIAAAQACWEASPGGELMEALETIRTAEPVRNNDVRHLQNCLEDVKRCAREALRQALPQGDQT